MGIRRNLLYASYITLKKLNYIRLKNSSFQAASILMFHRVNNTIRDSLTIPVKCFDDLMSEVKKNYIPLSLPSILRIIKEKGTIKPGTVVITFDDGYRDNYLYAAPILKKYNLPATFFITSGYINTKRTFPWDKNTPGEHLLMTWDEIKELLHMGFEMGAHTINHVNLGEVSLSLAMQEVVGSKRQIEKETSTEVTLFAFPFGRKDCIREEVLDVIKKSGFACCCSGYGGKVTVQSDVYNLHRVPLYPNVIENLMELDNFMTYFDGSMSFHII